MASGGGGRGFGPPPPPPKPAGDTTGAQGDGTAPPLHASASASAAAQADGIAPPLHGSVAQADGTAPPLRGSASASAAATGYVGMGAIRPQMRGAAGAGSREVNINSGRTTVQSDPPVTLSALGNDGTRTRMEAQISNQPEQGARISNVARAAANPPGRHDPSRVVPQTQSGAGSSFPMAQGIDMQGVGDSFKLPSNPCSNDGTRTRMEAQISTQPEQGVRISNVADAAANPPGRRDPSRLVSQIETGAGSSSSGGAQLLAQQAIHSQRFVEYRTVLDGIERLARNREWNLLEEYLTQIISMSGSTVDLHPRLLLYCRRGWLIRLLQSGSGSLAIRFHQGYVAPLRHVMSLYVDTQEMGSQLDVIWESITRDPSYTELLASHPGNIVDLIMDYMRLHFPDVVGHTNPPNTTNQFWAFGVLLGRESKKAKLRCLLCQHPMTSDRVGQDMARHLRQSCPRMTPHWRAKVEAFSHESSSKKRPRAAASKQAGLSKAQEAISRLARLRLNEGARYHASILRRQLEAIAQLGNEPFFLAGRLEAAVSALLDLMAAFMLEGQEASPALNELIVHVYKLQFLIPYCLAHVQPNAPTQMVQDQDETVSHSQQQHVAVPATQQQQQQQVAATSALPQEQAVAAQQQQEPAVAAQQQQEQVVAAQQQQEQVVVPLVEDQAHHADHGDDPFNILMGDAELDQLLHFVNELLEGGQGDPPHLV